MSKILKKESVLTGLEPESVEASIRRAGKLLLDGGYIEDGYIEGMIARDKTLTVAIGNHIAIPHGEIAYKKYVKHTGICVMTYPDGIPWGDELVKIVIGIAADGDDHISILENIVEVLEDEEDVINVATNADADAIVNIFTA
ncbi:MAG: PTS sugar transporter subunit IIA [Clostridiales Family XIII bacterium]|jgi:PTS system mannitol-specific IIC component|nr:PTS sugar transporter subunit IIA [Clostridiales Family XIII bacterium]